MKLETLTLPDKAEGRDERPQPVSVPKRSWQPLFLSFVLLTVCVLAAWSVVEAWRQGSGRLTTTGCEEEALFTIWKFTQGDAIYTRPEAAPFSVSYFNWLFSLFYGGAAKVVLALFHLKMSSALPAVARFVTVGFAAASIAIIYTILGRLNPARLAGSRLGRLACSIVLVVNPLTGSWLITARPDIAALTCELAGLLFALRYAEKRTIGYLLGAVIAGYAAWSFKQNFVHLLGGLFLFLLLRRQWRELGLAVAASVAMVGVTMLVGGADFRHALFGAQMNCRVSVDAAWEFFQRATGAAPQLVAIAAGLGIAVVWRKRWPGAGPLDLLAGVASVALVIGLAGVSKQGADTHYFIPVSIVGVIWGLGLFRTAPDDTWKVARFVHWAILVMFGLGIVTGLWPHARQAPGKIAGIFGQPTGAGKNETAPAVSHVISQLKQNLNGLPGPVFVTDRACNLPWIQTKAPHFVYSFTYALDRKAGGRFERGGIGGLIEEGYFETVVVLARNCACESSANQRFLCSHVTMNHLPLVQNGDVPSIDNGRMSHYQLAFSDGVFAYYRKK